MLEIGRVLGDLQCVALGVVLHVDPADAVTERKKVWLREPLEVPLVDAHRLRWRDIDIGRRLPHRLATVIEQRRAQPRGWLFQRLRDIGGGDREIAVLAECRGGKQHIHQALELVLLRLERSFAEGTLQRSPGEQEERRHHHRGGQEQPRAERTEAQGLLRPAFPHGCHRR